MNDTSQKENDLSARDSEDKLSSKVSQDEREYIKHQERTLENQQRKST